MTRTDRGFTLLEILVALVVLGFLMAGITEALRAGLRFWQAQEQASDADGDLGAVDGALRRLIEQMEPQGRDGVGGLGGSVSMLHMVTYLPRFADALPSSQAETVLFADPAGNLVLRWTPHPHVVPVGAAPRSEQTVLLRNVATLSLAYLPAGPASVWKPAWDGTTLPRLVRLHIGFPRGDPRAWPDIVAAPVRAS